MDSEEPTTIFITAEKGWYEQAGESEMRLRHYQNSKIYGDTKSVDLDVGVFY